MHYFVIILAACILLGMILKKTKPAVDYTAGYQRAWLFSYNEKKAFYTIQKVAKEKGYTALAKVRLFDLVEPKAEMRKDKAYQWKVQSKHVDFVVCDEKLVARWVIELQDSSHKAADRRQRDKFVNRVLTNCGYKILETYSIEEDKLRAFLR